MINVPKFTCPSCNRVVLGAPTNERCFTCHLIGLLEAEVERTSQAVKQLQGQGDETRFRQVINAAIRQLNVTWKEQS